MKKLFLTLVIAAVAAWQPMAAQTPELNAMQDTITRNIAAASSLSIRTGVEKGQIDKEQFMQGYSAVMTIADEQESYRMGMDFALQTLAQMKQFQQYKLNLNKNVFNEAFIQAMADTSRVSIPMTEAYNKAANEGLRNGVIAINGYEGEEYVRRLFKSGLSYKTTESGLVYFIVKEGEGENFKPDDDVQMTYVGRHVNQEIFDQSNDTVTFNLQQVVPGFREAVTLLKPGGQMVAVLPGKLAYGDRGMPQGKIAPNETLVFEILAFGVKQKDPAVEADPATLAEPAPPTPAVKPKPKAKRK